MSEFAYGFMCGMGTLCFVGITYVFVRRQIDVENED